MLKPETFRDALILSLSGKYDINSFIEIGTDQSLFYLCQDYDEIKLLIYTKYTHKWDEYLNSDQNIISKYDFIDLMCKVSYDLASNPFAKKYPVMNFNPESKISSEPSFKENFLIIATELGYTNIIKKHIHLCKNIGFTILEIGCKYRHNDIIDLFISNYFDLTFEDYIYLMDSYINSNWAPNNSIREETLDCLINLCGDIPLIFLDKYLEHPNKMIVNIFREYMLCNRIVDNTSIENVFTLIKYGVYDLDEEIINSKSLFPLCECIDHFRKLISYGYIDGWSVCLQSSFSGEILADEKILLEIVSNIELEDIVKEYDVPSLCDTKVSLYWIATRFNHINLMERLLSIESNYFIKISDSVIYPALMIGCHFRRNSIIKMILGSNIVINTDAFIEEYLSQNMIANSMTKDMLVDMDIIFDLMPNNSTLLLSYLSNPNIFIQEVALVKINQYSN